MRLRPVTIAPPFRRAIQGYGSSGSIRATIWSTRSWTSRRKHSINAGGIVTCVGSLNHARLRYANQNNYEDLDAKGQHFEIVSLVGTFSTTDRHLHLALANEQGAVFGGHASSGNKVFTTAEIIIVEGLDWTFRREKDPDMTFLELSPVQNK